MEQKLAKISVLYVILLSIAVNSFMLIKYVSPWLIALFLPIYAFTLIFAGVKIPKTKNIRWKICFHGAAMLSIFLFTAIISVLYHIILAFFTIPNNYWDLIFSFIVCYAFMSVFFLGAVICVYSTSIQLGIKLRILGVLLWLIPGANLIVLYYILKTIFKEIEFETAKEEINLNRRHLKMCATKYPILLVHGVCFRDQKHLNYWGRIPNELFINGARVFYGNQQSAIAIKDSAEELIVRVKEICESFGCEKLNIIAHSKGGLDCRYAIENLGMGQYVASLTTISTPHKGCEYADYLLNKIPQGVKNFIALRYNNMLKRLGDHKPDFLAAMQDLTASACAEFNEKHPTPDYFFTQSIGSLIPKNATFGDPFDVITRFIRKSDGTNDGLVGEDSFPWGEKFTLISSRKKYGVSHCDITDLFKKNIDGFDVREFYVDLVYDLKKRGL